MLDESKVTHTPGEWKASRSKRKRWSVAAEQPSGIPGPLSKLPIGYIVAVVHNGAPGDTLETEAANARLISAAPDLLAACRLARGVLYAAWNSNDDMGETNEAYLALRAVDAAVAKATGVEATHE